MKSFAFVLIVVQAVLIQNAYTQFVGTGPCGCSLPSASSPVFSAPVYVTTGQSSVAASLADTLSLLTVSSLLADSLPLSPDVIATIPVPVLVGPACAPAMTYGGCGCGGSGGCGCGGYNGLGCSYIY